jgi:paraquat-inducible protein A
LLQAGPYRQSASAFIWSCLALLLFLLSSRLDILEVNKVGLSANAGILVAWQGLSETGMPFLGTVAGAFVVWLPITALVLLTMIHMGAILNWRFPGWNSCLRLYQFARKWAMPEVFILAVVVAFLKIGDIAVTTPRAGLWLFAGAAFCMLVAFDKVDRSNLHMAFGPGEAAKPHRPSLHASLAFLLTALILLVPANLLPIMTVSTTSGHTSSTIFGGVAGLVEHNMWGIAAIVFTASILVPFGKIGALGWLIRATRRPLTGTTAFRVHAIIEFIGRWSMLDIFLIALLAGLIRFEGLAEIRPGPAAVPFAAAVIFTVLAVEHFDTTRIRTNPAGKVNQHV